MPRSSNVISRRRATRNFRSGSSDYVDPGFDFGTIAGLKLDFHPLKPKLGTGNLQNGDPIPSLKDYKNSQVFSQATMSKRPTWNKTDADFNGRPSMTFDGYDDFLLLSSAYLTGTVGSIFGVIKNQATNNGIAIVGSAKQTASNRFLKLEAHSTQQKMFIHAVSVSTNKSIHANNIVQTNGKYCSFLSRW